MKRFIVVLRCNVMGNVHVKMCYEVCGVDGKRISTFMFTYRSVTNVLLRVSFKCEGECPCKVKIEKINLYFWK